MLFIIAERKALSMKRVMSLAGILLLAVGFAAAQKLPSKTGFLAGKTRKQLIDCFSSSTLCGAYNMWDIADALDKPGNETFLLSQFQKRKSKEQQLGIIYSLYHIKDQRVEAFYKRLIAEKYNDGEYLYYPLNYLAKGCNKHALWVLSGGGKGGFMGRPACLQWATTVELFGKCNYRPAVPMLINSLNYACMNVGAAADDSLRKLFPGSPNFNTIKAEEQYYRRRSSKLKGKQ